MRLHNIGTCHLYLGDIVCAEQAIRSAASLDSRYALPLFNLAVIAHLQGDEAKAESPRTRAAHLGVTGGTSSKGRDSGHGERRMLAMRVRNVSWAERRVLLALVLAAFLAACTAGGPVTSPKETPETKLAVEFAEAVGSGHYDRAHSFLASSLRSTLSVAQLKSDFTNMTGYGSGAPTTIAATVTMDSWPDKKSEDLKWVYVAMANDTYSEAVTVVVASEGGKPVIRSVEWGRP